MISKSEHKVLFAEAEEDFIDQLLSFLTIPLITVERLEEGNNSLGYIENLHKSSADWNDTLVFDSSIRDLKNNLLNPLIAPAKVRNQLLPVYILRSSSGNIGGVYVKSGTKSMVKDDLRIEPFSSPSALSILAKSKVAERDLKQMDLSIGVNEVFGILKAAMLSTSALTIGLRPLLNRVKEEK
ncbi:hypothetical protein K1719_020831 [Acacia pycnantha]|nr:hypothetical protein K1719_020831 [Acacia pycnantha]